MSDLYKDCTVDCERMPRCEICGKTKKPIGRDVTTADYCDDECEGYRQEPTPGHLWPGELAEIRGLAEIEGLI